MIVGKNFINGQVVADLQSFENHKNHEIPKFCQPQRKLSKKTPIWPYEEVRKEVLIFNTILRKECAVSTCVSMVENYKIQSIGNIF